MISDVREKLGKEIEALSHELNVILPRAIAQAVELGDLRENSEYKSALERQQFVQARLGQLHQRLDSITQLASAEAPLDRVGLGSTVTVLDLESGDQDTYSLVFADIPEGTGTAASGADATAANAIVKAADAGAAMQKVANAVKEIATKLNALGDATGGVASTVAV